MRVLDGRPFCEWVGDFGFGHCNATIGGSCGKRMCKVSPQLRPCVHPLFYSFVRMLTVAAPRPPDFLDVSLDPTGFTCRLTAL